MEKQRLSFEKREVSLKEQIQELTNEERGCKNSLDESQETIESLRKENKELASKLTKEINDRVESGQQRASSAQDISNKENTSGIDDQNNSREVYNNIPQRSQHPDDMNAPYLQHNSNANDVPTSNMTAASGGYSALPAGATTSTVPLSSSYLINRIQQLQMKLDKGLT